MKWMRKIAGLLLLSLLIVSCEKDLDGDTETRDRFLGTWNVLETEGWSSPQNYSVEIVAGSGGDEIIIKGLYNIQGLSLKGFVAGNYLSIAQQTSQGFTVEGQGQANRNFDQITIDFTVNDGGSVDQVKAVLTP